MLLSLGTINKCTRESMHQFAKIYSLPVHKYKNPRNINQCKRYAKWIDSRNRLVKGFTKDEKNYYLIARREFHHYYTLYGFCSICKVLRCSPIWCICGRKELSNGWTSKNKKLDKVIRQTQIQTKTANDAYLEWLPFDLLEFRSKYSKIDTHESIIEPASTKESEIQQDLATFLNSSIASGVRVELIPLEMSDMASDLFYHKVTC